MKKRFLLISLYIGGLLLLAQAQKYPVLNIPVFRNGVQMRLPWTGGMDSPEFSYIDMNGDGVPDLYVFDKAGAKSSVYINTGGIGDTAYRYAPEYATLIPGGLQGWALMRDYNNDGVPDLFTHLGEPTGTRVFKGSRPNGILHYDLVCPLVKYFYDGYYTNLWTNIEDVPIITDVNGDGYLDFLTYGIFGTSVSYYQNLTGTQPGNAAYDIDSFQYLLVNPCWGDFTQNYASNSIILNNPECTSAPCNSGVHLPAPPALKPLNSRDSRHTGNSMYTIYPPNGDTIFDVLNGNIGFETLMHLQDTTNSNVCADMGVWDSLWPTCTTPVIIASYPAAFGVHVNGNANLEDLLVAPCSDWLTGFNINNVWQYNNTGNPSCQYQFEGDTFLVEYMLDFGTDSKPVFYDMNGDSLLDMMIGDHGYFVAESVYKSTIAYYQNTGTATQPQYTRVTDDYDSISKYGLVDVTPAFGDLNGDGKPDMVVGEINGWVHVFLNQGTGNASSFPTITYPDFDSIKVNNGFSAPFVYDVNGDGLNDLIIGNANGNLEYYWNYGTKQSPMFSRDSSNLFFGGVNVLPDGFYYGLAQPWIMKDSAGNMLLLVGCAGGTIYEYVINPDSIRPVQIPYSYYNYDSVLIYADSLHAPSFTCLTSNFLGQNVGNDASISVGNITNSGHLNYLIGCEMGGLLMFSDTLYDSMDYINSISALHMNELQIFPNPTRNNFTCTAGNLPFVNPQVEVFNVFGEVVPANVSISTDKVMVFTNGLSNGFYLVRISDQNQSYTGKVLLER